MAFRLIGVYPPATEASGSRSDWTVETHCVAACVSHGFPMPSSRCLSPAKNSKSPQLPKVHDKPCNGRWMELMRTGAQIDPACVTMCGKHRVRKSSVVPMPATGQGSSCASCFDVSHCPSSGERFPNGRVAACWKGEGRKMRLGC